MATKEEQKLDLHYCTDMANDAYALRYLAGLVWDQLCDLRASEWEDNIETLTKAELAWKEAYNLLSTYVIATRERLNRALLDRNLTHATKQETTDAI